MPAWNLYIDKSGKRMEKLYIKVNKDAFRERLVLLENENKVRERA